MKKIFDKKIIFSFIFGILLCSGIVYGVNTYQSETIQYSSTDASWKVNNVNEAINDLYIKNNELKNEYQQKLKNGHIAAVYVGCSNNTAWENYNPVYVDSQLGTYSSDGVYTLKYDGDYQMYSAGTSTDYSNLSGKGNTGGGRFLVNGDEFFTNSFTSSGYVHQAFTLKAGDKIRWQIYGTLDYCAFVTGILYKL